jgi:hypothetical protein
MKFARRFMSNIDTYGNEGSVWAVEVAQLIRMGVELSEDSFAMWRPVSAPVRVVFDAPGWQAKRIQVFEGRLLLASLERTPARSVGEDNSIYKTIRDVRVEWRCRAAGQRRVLGNLLFSWLDVGTLIGERKGSTHIIFAFDPERREATTAVVHWREKHAALMRRVAREHEPKTQLVEASPGKYASVQVIAPTVDLQFIE